MRCTMNLSAQQILSYPKPFPKYINVHFNKCTREDSCNSRKCCKEMSRLVTKPTKWHVRAAKTQISLGICLVWSESSLCAHWVAKDPTFLHADSEDSDQTGWMPRLICLCWAHMPFCWFCHEAAQMRKANHESVFATYQTEGNHM